MLKHLMLMSSLSVVVHLNLNTNFNWPQYNSFPKSAKIEQLLLFFCINIAVLLPNHEAKNYGGTAFYITKLLVHI